MNQILKVLWCFSLSLVLLGLEERKVHVGMAAAHCGPKAGSLGHLQASGDHSVREGSRASSAGKESQCGAVTQALMVHHTSPKCLRSRSYLQGGHCCRTVMPLFVSWMLLDLFQELRFPTFTPPHHPHTILSGHHWLPGLVRWVHLMMELRWHEYLACSAFLMGSNSSAHQDPERWRILRTWERV